MTGDAFCLGGTACITGGTTPTGAGFCRMGADGRCAPGTLGATGDLQMRVGTDGVTAAEGRTATGAADTAFLSQR